MPRIDTSNLEPIATQAHDALQTGQRKAAEVIDRIKDRASETARHGAELWRDGSERVRTQAVAATDRTVGYVKDEPVRSALIIAAVGAGVYLLVRWANRAYRSM